VEKSRKMPIKKETKPIAWYYAASKFAAESSI